MDLDVICPPFVRQSQQHGQVVTVGHDAAAQLVEQVVLAVGDQCGVNATASWVQDSSAETTVDSHSQKTTSITATAHRFAAGRCVKS